MNLTLAQKLLAQWVGEATKERGRNPNGTGEILAWFAEDMKKVFDEISKEIKGKSL